MNEFEEIQVQVFKEPYDGKLNTKKLVGITLRLNDVSLIPQANWATILLYQVRQLKVTKNQSVFSIL